MRYAGLLAAALIILSCGPDPNATLPQLAQPAKGGSGGSGSGGSGSGGSGSGGKSTQPDGSGGSEKGGSGGQSRTGGRQGTGGKVGTGGSVEEGTGGGGGRIRGSGGSGDGGADGTGGRIGPQGGRAVTGGRIGSQGGAPGSGGRSGPPIDGGADDEPCTPAKTISGAGSGTTGNFGTTGEFCFRTQDNITGWGCSNFTGRTLKVNSTAVECAKLPLPAKVNGYYYFDASGGTTAVDYAAIYWY
jgi:hypothetical protein